MFGIVWYDNMTYYPVVYTILEDIMIYYNLFYKIMSKLKWIV